MLPKKQDFRGETRLIDFQRIRQSADIVAVAKWLGLEVHGGKSRCPFHQDRTPSLSLKDGRFKCFGCDASGDVVDLVARMKDISTLEAVAQVTEAFHLDEYSPTPRKPMEFKEDLSSRLRSIHSMRSVRCVCGSDNEL